MAVPAMTCPNCDCERVSPHPQSTSSVAIYDCPQCRQEWSARFHGDRPFAVVTYSQEETAVFELPIVAPFSLTVH